MENVGEDVRKRRWKLIGYIGKNITVSSTAITWAPEGRQRRVDPGKHGEEEQRRREKEGTRWRNWRECPLIS